MSKSRSRNQAPEGLVIPKHRYKFDAKTRAAVAVIANIPLGPGAPALTTEAMVPKKPKLKKRRPPSGRRPKTRRGRGGERTGKR
jgi:hypothetical protein